MNGKGKAEADSTKMRGPAYRVDKKAMSKCGRLVPLDTPDVGWQGECTWVQRSRTGLNVCPFLMGLLLLNIIQLGCVRCPLSQMAFILGTLQENSKQEKYYGF
jgi:hypothetical protein